MTIFYILPLVLLSVAALSIVTQQFMGDFVDREVLLRVMLLGLTAWSLTGWLLETREASPEDPRAPLPSVQDSVAAIIAPRATDPKNLLSIAALVVREARLKRVDPLMVAAIMQVENPWLLRDAVSSAGAVGLMQVMPLHEDEWGCSGPLHDAETSICLGTAIFAAYLAESLRDALLRYNGCASRNPRCQGYPDMVMGNLPR